jgi:cytochrome c oxidase subunit 3
MPRLMPTSARRSPFDGDSVPPHTGGGGDGREDGDNPPDSTPNYGDSLRRARRALAVALVPIFMLFISFAVVYLIRSELPAVDLSRPGYVQGWVPVRLPWTILVINTVILILSSVTIEFARREVTREAALAPVRSIPGVSLGDETHFPWLGLTTILGIAFLAGQLFVWSKLSLDGFHLAGGTSVSFVYILTGMHGLHLTGGLIALIVANLAAILHRPVEMRRIVVDITAWYWHCMTILWICILALFSFAAR